MKTMYVAKGFVLRNIAPVAEVEVVRDSDKSVWLPTKRGEERRAKMSDSDCYFDTYEEAANHQRKKFEMRVRSAKKRLADAEQRLAEIESML